jgi:AraC-like DNA-binding protein
MNPHVDFIGILILLGLSQAIFFAILLISSKNGNRLANIFLALLLVNLSFTLGDQFLVYTDYYTLFPHLLGPAWPNNFLYGVFIYLYYKSMTTADYRFGRRDAVHFLPFLISAIYLVPYFTLSGHEKILQWDAFEIKGNNLLILDIHVILTVTHIFSYVAFTIYKLAKLQHLLKDNFSFTEKLNLRWFQTVLYMFLMLLLIYGLREGLSWKVGMYGFAQYFLPISTTLSIYTMGFLAFRQRSILTEIEEISNTNDSNMPTQNVTKTESAIEKYKKSALGDDQTVAISKQLDTVMCDEKLFMDEDLSLPKLAQQIGTSSHHLSQVINSQRKQSFYDYVNGLRVTEVTMKLSNPEFAQQNILDIAMAAGFKSKSAFNKSFKKFTGLTPSQYKQSIRGSGHGSI